MVAAHLRQLHAQTGQDVARRVVDLVVPAQVAGVVQGDGLVAGQRRHFQPAAGDQFGDQFRTVLDLHVPLELRVLFPDVFDDLGVLIL